MDTFPATVVNGKTFKHMHQSTARLFYRILFTQIKPTFHKLNVHAAMTPTDIWNQLEPVFTQAKKLCVAFKNKVVDTSTLSAPFVTVSTWHM